MKAFAESRSSLVMLLRRSSSSSVAPSRTGDETRGYPCINLPGIHSNCSASWSCKDEVNAASITMYHFTSGSGSPSGHQNPQTLPYNGQQSTQHISSQQSWSTTQMCQSGMTAQGSLHRNQACYNCGVFNHWAQDCPEPRRAVPA